jgi:hypothetical protein
MRRTTSRRANSSVWSSGCPTASPYLFVLAAGLSGAGPQTRLTVIGGLAEIAAESVAMGLGGYLAAGSDGEHDEQERLREEREAEEIPDEEARATARVFQSYGLTAEESTPIVDALPERPKAWVDFMMRFEVGLEEPEARRALDQRGHNCRRVCRRWLPSTLSVHDSRQGLAWPAAVGARDPGRARGLRLH